MHTESTVVRVWRALDDAGALANLPDAEVILTRVERRFRNEVAERGGDATSMRLVGKWVAGVEYREWFLLAEDRRVLLAEVERLGAEVHRLQGPL